MLGIGGGGGEHGREARLPRLPRGKVRGAGLRRVCGRDAGRRERVQAQGVGARRRGHAVADRRLLVRTRGLRGHACGGLRHERSAPLLVRGRRRGRVKDVRALLVFVPVEAGSAGRVRRLVGEAWLRDVAVGIGDVAAFHARDRVGERIARRRGRRCAPRAVAQRGRWVDRRQRAPRGHGRRGDGRQRTEPALGRCGAPCDAPEHGHLGERALDLSRRRRDGRKSPGASVVRGGTTRRGRSES
jgi:hypothetical protein